MNIDDFIVTAKEVIYALKQDSLSRRESSSIEFKETYRSGPYERFSKSLAAFANNSGGMIIFGIKDSPRIPLGLDKSVKFNEDRFRNIANNHFYPELEWEFKEFDLDKETYGLLLIHEGEQKPHVCIKQWSNEVTDGVIYYRYRGENLAIRSADLIKLLESRLRKELLSMSEQVSTIAKAKPQNTAVLDLDKGKITGSAGNLYIENDLLGKVKFIKRGKLSSRGSPTLRVIGDVQPVKTVLSEDSDAVPIQINESNFLRYTPMTYNDIMSELTKSVVGFSRTNEFFKVFKSLREDQQEKTTYLRKLNPSNKSEVGKWWYSVQFIQLVKARLDEVGLFKEHMK